MPRVLPPAPQRPSTWNNDQRSIRILSEFAHGLEWSLQWTLGNPGSEGYRLVQYFFLGSSNHLLQEGISSENFGKVVFLNDLYIFPSTACLLRRKLKSKYLQFNRLLKMAEHALLLSVSPQASHSTVAARVVLPETGLVFLIP